MKFVNYKGKVSIFVEIQLKKGGEKNKFSRKYLKNDGTFAKQG